MASPMLALPSAEATQPRQLVRTGVFLFITSATMLFGGLFAAYLHLRRNVVPWPAEGSAIDEYLVNMMAGTMILSILPIEWACWALRKNLVRQAMSGLGITIGLGVAFLNLGSYTAGQAAFDAASGPYGLVVTALFMLMSLCVAVGLGMLTLTLVRATGRQQGPADTEQARVAACWWHFTVGASLFVWYAITVLK